MTNKFQESSQRKRMTNFLLGHRNFSNSLYQINETKKFKNPHCENSTKKKKGLADWKSILNDVYNLVHFVCSENHDFFLLNEVVLAQRDNPVFFIASFGV